MRKIYFNHAHKSIERFESIDLPSFTVLTGVNGAGKSHLLEAIELNAVNVEGILPNQSDSQKLIRRFDWNTLIPQDNGALSSANISSEQMQFWHEIDQNRLQALVEFNNKISELGQKWLKFLKVNQLESLTVEDFVLENVPEALAVQQIKLIKQWIEEAEEQAQLFFVRNDPSHRVRLLDALKKNIPEFRMLTIRLDDFYRFFPNKWQPVDIFQQSFARLFVSYQRIWKQNKLKLCAKADGEDVDALSEVEFLKKYGDPPWDFLNEIFKVAELDFQINSPYKWDDRAYDAVITDVKRGTQVKFNDLSSGERVLMSFALCLYHATDQSSVVDFPKVLLFDEIDAPLHPSMTRSLLRTIQKMLVEKHGVFVILTTHSPSTVALAPEKSIFVMNKLGPDRVVPTTKDKALGILTAGVPTLSINYENRRQVFVESKNDVHYYSLLYQLCKPNLLPEISMMFIASGANGNGNCDQVKTFAGQLVSGGNKTVFGVIDWDLKNAESHPIMVLGEGERYSIENFLLDPLLIGGLLLRQVFETPESLGIDPSLKYINMRGFDPTNLQVLTDAVVRKMQSPKDASTDTTLFSYIGGFSVNVPIWFAHMQGHDLENCYKEAFPALLRYRNEPDLKMAVLNFVLSDYPEFVPAAVSDLFSRIQRSTDRGV